MAGIYISDDAQGWYESGPVRDVTIRNNTFTRGNAQAIFIEPTNPTVSTEKTVHSNIKIEGNTFFTYNKRVLDAKSVDNLTFKNNKIYRQDQRRWISESGSKRRKFYRTECSRQCRTDRKRKWEYLIRKAV